MTRTASPGPSRQPAIQRALQDLRIEFAILTERVAAAAGLSPRDLDVLDLVTHAGPLTPTALSARTGLRAATLTGVLARLERDGWVSRTRDLVDGRSTILTPAGRIRELDRRYHTADERLAEIVGRLGPQQADTVLRFLVEVGDLVRATDPGSSA